MSDFLVIIPEGWTQLDWQFVSNNGLDGASVRNAIASLNMLDIENPLRQMGLIADTASVLDVKLIDDSYFMVKLA